MYGGNELSLLSLSLLAYPSKWVWKGRKKIVVKKSIEVRVSLGRRGIVLERHIEYRGGNLLKANLKKECMMESTMKGRVKSGFECCRLFQYHHGIGESFKKVRCHSKPLSSQRLTLLSGGARKENCLG